MSPDAPTPESHTPEPLLSAILALNSQLDLPHVLDHFLTAATEQTGARYAAINIVDEDGVSVDFHYAGMPEGVWAKIGRAPNHVATLARIPHEGAIVIEELTKHPSFAGFPKNHPPMGAFLGTALKVRGAVFGYLYLADKEGGFTTKDEEAVLALAAGAAVAIDNAELYERAVKRERWLEASQKITTALLTDPGDEEAFSRIVDAAMELADAQHGVLVLPGVGDTWVMEFTAGPRATDLLGLVLPEQGFAITAIRSGEGTVAAAPPGGPGAGPRLWPDAVRAFARHRLHAWPAHAVARQGTAHLQRGRPRDGAAVREPGGPCPHARGAVARQERHPDARGALAAC